METRNKIIIYAVIVAGSTVLKADRKERLRVATQPADTTMSVSFDAAQRPGPTSTSQG